MTAKSWQTSFFALTGSDGEEDRVVIERIEIPLFQRDYAQGRENAQAQRIRNDFLDALHRAVSGDGPPIGLDFVYGGIDNGTLRPLDGQQRLTTLFLLHWYLASHASTLADEARWKQFTYATRQSARMFCESLVVHPLPDRQLPSSWICDQPWYLFVWRHDPTIQSILVMLDAIHDRFQSVDPAEAWARLTDTESPAISFLLLPLSDLGSAGESMKPEALYIKMNSRGKPLTEFENFKAHFEKAIDWSPERARDFALKVDTEWSDLLWHLRGDDDLIDDEFMRYMEFVTEICEWREGITDGAGQRLGTRAQMVFGAENPRREETLDFLLLAFDAWAGRSIPEEFEQRFAGGETGSFDASKVRLFFRSDSTQQSVVNLFEACCRSYGDMRGTTRVFSLGQSLMLYAIVLHLVEKTQDFPRRVRILRNLVEASSDQLRPQDMPKILEDLHHVIRHGAVDAVATLN